MSLMGASNGRRPDAVFDGFERHGREPDVAQPARELGQRREVQIAKQQMVLAQPLQVGLDGLLDLDDHLGFVEELVGASAARVTPTSRKC